MISLVPLTGPKEEHPNNQQRDQKRRRKPYQGATRLMQILLTEAAHIIWILRCKRVIEGRNHTDNKICKWWLQPSTQS